MSVAAVSFRDAAVGDAERVAGLHAESWRRHYRGAYTDSYLDGDVFADRLAVWSARLADPAPHGVTVLAEVAGEFAGFVHVVLDDDVRWGSLVDNLHVVRAHHRHGIGAALMRRAAGAVLERGATGAMYLWVLEQNTAARAFYSALGGRFAERSYTRPPGDVPGRLNGRPAMLRCVWPDAAALLPPG
ncbi:GNAT family N-acetyltransferase [Plantactinospora sp. KLBMP9567]|uniref:GNAT family N-acetyltransferase n=1 Tax=Plantactinospora sp. KLBMP9567 TaxID=3085900 RepID=UPI002981C95D|nr:GNAT family N-acetyltransferase [Plantactinospora sp. KLBMP9567]MDW5323686.1 GNAT family N-acetyltransferase [Plantactinospora sp. KLBMP9567]